MKVFSQTISKEFYDDVFQGLQAEHKRIPSKYFYDDIGSEIFRAIMRMSEYYPTRCEFEILGENAAKIASLLGGSFNVVELGAGDGHKTKLLLREFLEQRKDFTYIPIDISDGAMRGLSNDLKRELPKLVVDGLVCDYITGIEHLSGTSKKRNVVLFLGSNIGNFTNGEDEVFIRKVYDAMNDGDILLIGFDLVKDMTVLQRAYDDPAGITRDFNLNVLHRINRELGGQFDVSKFKHVASFNRTKSAMESHLVSLEDHTVWIDALHMIASFKEGERIHLEDSKKYTVGMIMDTAATVGFTVRELFFDSKKYFVSAIFEK